MTRLNVNDARCEALFASGLQPSDEPTAAALAELVSAAVRRYGVRGCADRMAQEFGDHPEAAAERMRWIRRLVAEVSVPPPARLRQLGEWRSGRCCPEAEAPAADDLRPAACHGILSAEPDARQDLRDRCLQGQPALLDELHDHRGRPDLGDGPDLEQRVSRGLHSGAGVQHPVSGQALAPVGPDPERGAGDAFIRGKLTEALCPVRGHIGGHDPER
jgi:hypothetical protein